MVKHKGDIYNLKKVFRIIFIIATIASTLIGLYYIILGNNSASIKFFVSAAVLFILNFIILKFM